MVSDLDIYRAANMLIERHGADALIEAARMIDRMLTDRPISGLAPSGDLRGQEHRNVTGPLIARRPCAVVSFTPPGNTRAKKAQ